MGCLSCICPAVGRPVAGRLASASIMPKRQQPARRSLLVTYSSPSSPPLSFPLSTPAPACPLPTAPATPLPPPARWHRAGACSAAPRCSCRRRPAQRGRRRCWRLRPSRRPAAGRGPVRGGRDAEQRRGLPTPLRTHAMLHMGFPSRFTISGFCWPRPTAGSSPLQPPAWPHRLLRTSWMTLMATSEPWYSPRYTTP